MADDQPDPRFKEFTQIFEGDRAIGFKLENNTFLFKYDEKGGWLDEENNYFNRLGVFQHKEDEWDEYDDKVEDVMVREMEELIKKEEGAESESSSEDESEEEKRVVPEQQPPQSSQPPQSTEPEKVPVTLDEKILHTVELINKHSPVKQSKKDRPVRIYLRVRKQKEQNKGEIKGEGYSLEKLNQNIRLQRKAVDETTRKLTGSLPKEASIQFSVQDGKIYWYGFVELKPFAFGDAYKQLLKDQTFGILKKRTLMHLRFFLTNEKASANQDILKQNIPAETGNIKLSLFGIPEYSPISYISDLLEECGVALQRVHAIRVSDKHADIEIGKEEALKIIELDGYEKDVDEYITIKIDKTDSKPTESDLYEIRFEDPTTNGEQIRQDLLLENSRESVARIKEGVMIVGIKVLQQILMYRESKVVPISIQRFSV